MGLIIDTESTRKLIDMARALKAVEDIFHARARGQVTALPRRRLKGEQRQLNIMAAWHGGWRQFALRSYMGGTNTITLYNGRAGKLLAILNAAYLSSLRTGAVSGVAAKYLAPRQVEVLGIIGTGKQAVFQLEALVPVCRPIRILVYGRNPQRRATFIRKMNKELKLPVDACGELEELAATSDVLALATDSSTPILDRNQGFKDEILIITIGANSAVKHEVTTRLVEQMDSIVTDTIDAAKADSGDLIAACAAGVLNWEKVVPLEQTVSSPAGAARPKKILFQSNGIAEEDLAVGHYVLEQAKRKKLKGRAVTGI
jgi:ornithine cyclodeaminase/alanine dehydrogenase-like protein (mu-crystallin family)